MSIISNEEARKILEKNGEVRGVAFQSIGDFILKNKGQAGLEKTEAQMKEWGADFHYSQISPMAWYPIGWGALFVLSTQEVFDWSEQNIREMGANGPNVSVVVKLMFKLFPSIKLLAKQIPGFWRKNYTVGEVEVASLDEGKKEMIIHFKDTSFHPSLCKYVEGFTETTLQFSRLKSSIVKVKETKCSFKDNAPYEEYTVSWT